MVASLLGLRLRSFANRIVRPRSAAEGFAILVAAVLVVVALVGIAVLAAAAAEATAELRGAGFVALGSLVVAGFWFLPLVFRIDDGMPLRAFAAYDIPTAKLAAALLLTRIISIPAVLLLVLLAVEAAAWTHRGATATVVAILAAVLILLTCLLGSQVASAIAGGQISWRNAGGVAVLLATAAAAPLAAALAAVDWAATGVTVLRRIAAALEWTPFGVAWGAPAAAAAGDAGGAWARLGVALGVVGILAVVWYAFVRRAESTAEAAPKERQVADLGVFDAMPPTAGGVVAARSIVYWMRDPRYAVPVLILPLVPLVIAVAFWLAGMPAAIIAWTCVPLVCLLLGWSVHNDIATDGTAFWLHVVTGIRGRADRWGRIVPPLVIGAAVAVGGSFLTAWLMHDRPMALPLIALSACTLLVGLGVGSAASAIAPYPTVAPGDGPFAQPQGLRGGESVKQTLSLLVAVLLCAPTAALVLIGVLGAPSAFGAAVVVGFATGVVVLVGGIELGALVLSRRAPEILAFTQQN